MPDWRRVTGATVHGLSEQLQRSLRDPKGGIPVAVVVEMVQGEGGVAPVDPDFVRRVRALVRALDIPLVVDESQTSYGPTGARLLLEQCNTERDVITEPHGITYWLHIGHGPAGVAS
jgi:acetylornithine/succinyldiaminopimelate/putrescine aminotransferase